MDFDVIIIGAGPGGLSAALYAARGGLKTLVLEGVGVGGQMNYTTDIDNYPGFSGTGPELSEKMHAQAEKFGVVFAAEKAIEIRNPLQAVKLVRTRRNEYRTKDIIISTGANPRKLGVMGEEEFAGAGVSYCATCDGAFFKDKVVTVVGGGNIAIEDALYLANFCRAVNVVHRREVFRASAYIMDAVKKNPKISIRTNEVVEKIQGDRAVKSLVLRHTISSKISVLDTDAVFVAIGRVPETSLVSEIVKLDNSGYIVTDENMRTNVPGIYAIGDVRNTPLRQVVTAAADGAVAANDIFSKGIGI